MILPIDDKWRIKSDAYCWAIQKRHGVNKLGEPKWDGYRYYSTLGSAVHGLAELELMTSDATTLDEALNAVRDVSERLSMALTPHVELK